MFGEPEPMTTRELVTGRARMLARLDSVIEDAKERLYRSRYRSKEQFERAHAKTLRTEPFSPGTLVLVRNSRMDSEINAKSQNRWLGPYIVVRVGRNGAYRLAELDGAVLAGGIAASRVVEFYPHQRFTLKPEDVLDGAGWERAWEEPGEVKDDEQDGDDSQRESD
ncbi:unnamed protein product [Rhizoctonia solani]|uniref:Uncharacterized protein n=1 Tax=Rhizoctonia solani TaxID=456999 RepID=A0A8H3A0K1_9AGAM|nr:unnamed protein product [Rhizoctonia solani]